MNRAKLEGVNKALISCIKELDRHTKKGLLSDNLAEQNSASHVNEAIKKILEANFWLVNGINILPKFKDPIQEVKEPIKVESNKDD